MVCLAAPCQAAPAQPPPVPAMLPNVLAEKGIRPDIVLENDKTEKNEKVKTTNKNKWSKISQLRQVLCRLN